ncbi:MAG: SAM-dependent methyltransferase [Roseofilum sp. SBFL]|uniref:tetratricopeptide repeat protein n=1 Tax=unclassified Roseofilum TaxID=2620099 RepID=UPI001B05BDF6|nr:MULTISPECIES: SAM-dependent methyltransferase [unclassified Roseofilum]MBP0012627.1 SAM-dependent methyltransferase [Roseofilum sp. SID3]MBP0023131.1 SAM-dependent methyltransferase [Roseofilum sp. SID2]MBP0039937.1 SAM-dependent methyltransferase [Roseofilum sp. SID1]MBP0042282.1 SAM-dependent methyltransferase [Roseofilum sp. SBFL]
MQPNRVKSSILETHQRFSQSLLWRFQREFFNQEGVQAWNTGKVPHYVTSNPFIANAYGKVVLGFLRDCVQHPQDQIDFSQPVYIVELGSGSGRFAYHFLKQFFTSHFNSALRAIPVKYIMTDLAEQNLEFWDTHPSLHPFIEKGLLDFARFDIEEDVTLSLRHSGEVLSSETIKNPLIVFANYFFDSIPQDLFSIQGGKLYETLLTVTAPEANQDLTDAALLDNLDITYEDAEIDADRYYENPAFNQILQDYQTYLGDTTLLFPSVGLQGMENLQKLSRDRLLLLSSDKGYGSEEQLQKRPRLKLSFHQGCFSLMVNYPAIARYTEYEGGMALLPHHKSRSIVIGAFLFAPEIECFVETSHAYQTAIEESSPDDFFVLKKAIEPHFDSLTLEQILTYLRFSHWDTKLFFGCFDTLMRQVESASEVLLQELTRAIHQIWETYYFIGEPEDLPFHCAMLLYKIEAYDRAIAFLQYSLYFYGEDPGMYHNQAQCYCKLQQWNRALEVLDKALALHPEFTAAQELKQQIEGENLKKM